MKEKTNGLKPGQNLWWFLATSRLIIKVKFTLFLYRPLHQSRGHYASFKYRYKPELLEAIIINWNTTNFSCLRDGHTSFSYYLCYVQCSEKITVLNASNFTQSTYAKQFNSLYKKSVVIPILTDEVTDT